MKTIILFFSLFFVCLSSSAYEIEVLDVSDQEPLPAASVFNREGILLGVTDEKGVYDKVGEDDYPLMVRYLGYATAHAEKGCERILLTPEAVALPEVNVKNNTDGVWILCYARGYYSIPEHKSATKVYTECMLDFLIPLKKSKGFKKITKPRFLQRKDIVYGRTEEDRNTTFKSSKGFSFGLFCKDIDKVETEKGELLRGEKGIYKERDGQKERIYKKGNGALSVTTDHLGYAKGHEYSLPGIVSALLGMKVTVVEDIETRMYSVNSHGKYYPTDLVSMSMTMKMLMSWKRVREKTHSDNPADCFLWMEIYPVEYKYITAEESKEMKNNPPKINFVKPENLSE